MDQQNTFSVAGASDLHKRPRLGILLLDQTARQLYDHSNRKDEKLTFQSRSSPPGIKSVRPNQTASHSPTPHGLFSSVGPVLGIFRLYSEHEQVPAGTSSSLSPVN